MFKIHFQNYGAVRATLQQCHSTIKILHLGKLIRYDTMMQQHNKIRYTKRHYLTQWLSSEIKLRSTAA